MDQIMPSDEKRPIEQHFLMILGRLSDDMIRQLEETQVAGWMMGSRDKMDALTLEEWDRFTHRDRSLDKAFYTLYAYDDIPIGHSYDTLFHKAIGSVIRTRCVIEHVIWEGRIPVLQLAAGHKHIIFLSFDSPPPDCIPAFNRWEDIVRADWQYGLCDWATYESRQSGGEEAS